MRSRAITADAGGGQVSLDNLNDDVLLELCACVGHVSSKGYVSPSKSIVALLADPLENLTTLRSLSLVNRRFRNLTAPALFRKIHINGDLYKVSRGLGVVEKCPALLENVKSFKFDVFTQEEPGPLPPKDLAPRLADALTSMPKLEALHLRLPEFRADIFADEFKAANVSLGGVKNLIVGSFCDFVIQHCPNVSTVSSNGWIFLYSTRSEGGEDWKLHATQLIEAAGRAPHLKNFEMDQWWQVRQLEQIHRNMPDITRLRMTGGGYYNAISAFYKTLSCFKHLEELILASAPALNVGFEPPLCGSMYSDDEEDELADQVEKEWREADERVARDVFNACKQLKWLWVGDSARAKVERDENGATKNITWAYEDRKSPLRSIW